MTVAGKLARPLAGNLARRLTENRGDTGGGVDNLLIDDTNTDNLLIDDTNTDVLLLQDA